MKPFLKRLLFILTTVLIGIPLSAYFYWSTTCACEKDPGEHFAPWNPFRDREPEREAEKLFQGLSLGKCDDETLCGKAIKHGRVRDWSLSVRKVEGNRALLAYHVDYEDAKNDIPVFVDVRRSGNGWKITQYSQNY